MNTIFYKKSLCAFLSTATLVCSSQVNAKEKWDMALAYAATNYHSEIATEFANAVTEATSGELEIVTHPSGSLFSGDEIYQAVRKGLTPIGERLISALANEDAFYELDSVPFIATTFEDSWKLYQASKPKLEEKLNENNLVFLYSAPWPPQGFYSIKEAQGKADLKGLKFRAYNTTTSQMAEQLGMVPTKVEAAELSQAFATGVAESMISSGSTGYDRKLWEHVKYFYTVNAWLPRNMVIVNKRAWDKLDENTQNILQEQAAIAEQKSWQKAEELTNWYIEEFEKNDMQVSSAGEQLQKDFEEVGKILEDEWLERTGEEGQAILDAYKSQ